MIEGQMKLRRNMNGIYKYYNKQCYLVVVVDFYHLNAKNTTFHFYLVIYVETIKSSCLQKYCIT